MKYNNADSEAEFLTSLERTEEKGARILHERYFRMLRHFIQEIIPFNDLAPEIANKAIYKVWKQGIKFDSAEHAKNYLFITAKNLSLNALKAHNSKQDKQEEVSFWREQDELLHEAKQKEAEIVHKVYELIKNELAPRQRQIMQLLFEEGLKPAEIAKKLDISVRTVNNTQEYCLKILRKLIKEKPILLIFLCLFSPN